VPATGRCNWFLEGGLEQLGQGEDDRRAGFSGHVAIAAWLRRPGRFLESGLSGERMAEALSQATVALMTGGMIVYEALAVGVPAIVFPQIENLVPEARWFAQRAALPILVYEGGTNSGLVSEMVGRLLASSSERLAMSSAQRATIDGRGMLRAAKEIDGLLADSGPSVERRVHREQESQS